MEGNGLIKFVLFSHEIILSAESLGKLEAEIPKRLHPFEQEQSGVELPFSQGDGRFPENNQ